jgi:hypothetical protein
MRLFELKNPTPETLNEFIQKNCQTYLSANPDFKNNPLYHGSKYLTDAYTIVNVNHERLPRDTPLPVHKAFIKGFDQAGIKANRGNSMFVTGDFDVTISYGKAYQAFPIGNFDFAWSSKVFDLYSHEAWTNLFAKQLMIIKNYKEYFDYMSGKTDLEKLIAYYLTNSSIGSNWFEMKRENGWKSWEDVPEKLIQPHIGKILMDFKQMDTDDLSKLEVEASPKFVQWAKKSYNVSDLQKGIKANVEILIHAKHVLLVRQDYLDSGRLNLV